MLAHTASYFAFAPTRILWFARYEEQNSFADLNSNRAFKLISLGNDCDNVDDLIERVKSELTPVTGPSITVLDDCQLVLDRGAQRAAEISFAVAHHYNTLLIITAQSVYTTGGFRHIVTQASYLVGDNCLGQPYLWIITCFSYYFLLQD